MKIQRIPSFKLKLLEASSGKSYKNEIDPKTYVLLNKEDKETIDKGEVTLSIINKLDPNRDAKTLFFILKITKNNILLEAIYRKLLETEEANYAPLFGNGMIPIKFDNKSINLLIDEIANLPVSKVISGNVPIFEYMKKVSQLDTKIPYETLQTIYNLNEKGKLTDLDLKSNKWLFNPKIYSEEDFKNQIYWIKFYIFMQNKDNLKNFKDKNGNLLFNNVTSDWEYWANSKLNATEIQEIFSRYDDSEAQSQKQKENLYTISLQDWILKQKNWPRDTKSIFKEFTKIFDSNQTTIVNKEETLEQLKELFSSDSRTIERFYRLCDIDKNLDSTNVKDYNKIVTSIQKYFEEQRINSLNSSPIKRLKPNSIITFGQALEFNNLTPKQAYGKLRPYILKKDNISGSNYSDVFKKIFENEDLFNDLLNAKIKVTSKGAIPWTNFIVNYLDNVRISNTKD